MTPEWSDWHQHNAQGCPSWLIGEWIEVEGHNRAWGNIERAQYQCTGKGDLWFRRHVDHGPNIIRFRVRKPRGLVVLEKVLADLPEKVTA